MPEKLEQKLFCCCIILVSAMLDLPWQITEKFGYLQSILAKFNWIETTGV